MRYDIRHCRMIYLLRKHDIISVPSYAAGIYHRTECDIISKIYHPFWQERISLKKVTFVSRQKWLFSWPARRDSNPRPLESESTAISSFATGGGWLAQRARHILHHFPTVCKRNFTFSPHSPQIFMPLRLKVRELQFEFFLYDLLTLQFWLINISISSNVTLR